MDMNPVTGGADLPESLRVVSAPAPVAAGTAGKSLSLLEEPFIYSPGTGPVRIPSIDRPVVEEPRREIAGTPAVRKTSSRRRRSRRSRRRRRAMRRAVFIIAGGAILLLALKVFLFEFPQAGREQWHMYSFERGSSPSGSATGDPNPDFHDVQGDYVQRLQGGKLFVVRGTVASTGNGSAGGIRILAMLLSSHGKLLAEETVIAGNVIPDETLRTIDREAALKLLRRRQDRQPEHDRLPAGKFIPFTLVFFDPPEEIESFAVKKVDTR